jgi:hypothetical protein
MSGTRDAAHHRVSSLRFVALTLLSPLACTSAATSQPQRVAQERSRGDAEESTGRARRIEIDDPLGFWGDQGYSVLVPAVRMSIPPGGRAGTAIFFKIPGGDPILSKTHPSQVVPASFVFPTGTSADRVAYVMLEDEAGDPVIRVLDVRGTRIGSDGTQYFRVLRPGGPELDAPMIGYEWPRDDERARDEATYRLLDELKDVKQPIVESTPSPQSLARLALLNHCEICHLPDKGPSAPDSHLPAWPTDGSGFYIPLAVLMDHAPLSTQPGLHDPNAEDPYIETSCGSAPAAVDGAPNNKFFSCPDEERLPMGRRDIRRGMEELDAYTMLVCGSRAFLLERMETGARDAFTPLMDECTTGEDETLVELLRH